MDDRFGTRPDRSDERDTTQAVIDLTSIDLQRGSLLLPAALRGRLPAGSLIAAGPEADLTYELESRPPRELLGLGGFYEDHGLRPNDAVRLEVGPAGVHLQPVKRVRKPRPTRPAQAAERRPGPAGVVAPAESSLDGAERSEPDPGFATRSVPRAALERDPGAAPHRQTPGTAPEGAGAAADPEGTGAAADGLGGAAGRGRPTGERTTLVGSRYSPPRDGGEPGATEAAWSPDDGAVWAAIRDYLGRPDTPAVVRAAQVAERLDLPAALVGQELAAASRDEEGPVVRIRPDVYLVKLSTRA